MIAPTLAELGFEQKVIIGIAEMAVSNNTNATLTTYSLGSCLGITLYDPEVRVGGLLHIMLPDSRIDSGKATAQPAMFVDSGFPALLGAACKLGADKRRVQICVAGGAQIMDNSGHFNIGKRNYEAFTKMLNEHGLRCHAEQVGGMVNRTLYLNLATGDVRLKISGQPQEIFLCKS